MERDARLTGERHAQGKLRKLKRWMSAGSPVGELDLALAARLLGIADAGHPDLATSSPDRLVDDTRTALVGRLLQLARRVTLLLVVEDAQWMDPSSLKLLRYTLQSLERHRGARMILIITHRPEFSPPCSESDGLVRIALDRLDLDGCRSMVRNIAGGERALTRRIVEQIAVRSDGIPFFVEELTKAVLESGDVLAPTSVPASLHDSLTARLDRVGPSKLVAQLGACIGRSFSFSLLGRIAALDEWKLGESLTRLVAADLIVREGDMASATFTFRHALVQSAAYESMLRSDRRQVHAAIARELAMLPSVEHGGPEVLARHLTEAGDHAAALDHWLDAGLEAQGRSAHVEAISHLKAGLRSLVELPPSPLTQAREIELQCALARSYMAAESWQGRRVYEAYARARSLCRARGDARKECEVLWGLWAHHAVRGELDKARAQAEEYVQFAEGARDAAALLMADSTALVSSFCIGDFASAEHHATRIHANYVLEEHGRLVHIYHQDPLAIACIYESSWLWICGWPDRAERAACQAVEHARRLGHPFQLCHTLFNGAGALVWRKENAKLLAWIEEGLSLARERRIPMFRIYGPLWGIPALVEREPSPSILREFRGSIDSMLKTNARLHVPFYLMQLAAAHDLLGQQCEALSIVEEALSLLRVTSERWVEPELLRMRAVLRRSDAAADATEGDLREALERARSLRALGLELRVVCDLAELMRKQTREREARSLLDRSLGAFREGFETADLRRALDIRRDLGEERQIATPD